MRDMILWFATPAIRGELIYLMTVEPDNPMMEDLEVACREIILHWAPTTKLQYGYYRHGRHLDWMVWSTVSAADESMVTSYVEADVTNGQMPVEPWGIDITTLPTYASLPTNYVMPDDDSVKPIDWMTRHN